MRNEYVAFRVRELHIRIRFKDILDIKGEGKMQLRRNNKCNASSWLIVCGYFFQAY